jgi:hypothetical protein
MDVVCYVQIQVVRLASRILSSGFCEGAPSEGPNFDGIRSAILQVFIFSISSQLRQWAVAARCDCELYFVFRWSNSGPGRQFVLSLTEEAGTELCMHLGV